MCFNFSTIVEIGTLEEVEKFLYQESLKQETKTSKNKFMPGSNILRFKFNGSFM